MHFLTIIKQAFCFHHCGGRCYQQGHKGARQICVQQINKWTLKGPVWGVLSSFSNITGTDIESVQRERNTERDQAHVFK